MFLEVSLLPNLVELMQKISADTQRAGQPTDIVYGKVINVSPVSIMIDQKTILTSDFLILTKSVTKHQVDMNFSCNTEDEEGHSHKINFSSQVTINNQLKTNDKVIMIKQAGGQNYIVLDKIGG